MNKVQEALKAAIEALETGARSFGVNNIYINPLNQCKSALSEIDKCEPVAWKYKNMYGVWRVTLTNDGFWNDTEIIPLYTSPISKEWVGLTDEDIRQVFRELKWTANRVDFEDARAIESKLKQLNAPEKG